MFSIPSLRRRVHWVSLVDVKLWAIRVLVVMCVAVHFCRVDGMCCELLQRKLTLALYPVAHTRW